MDTDDYRISGDDQDDQDDLEELDNGKKKVKVTGSEIVKGLDRRGNHTSRKIEPLRRTRYCLRAGRSGKPSSHKPQDKIVDKQEIWLKKNAKHANAFINFVQDYRKENPQTMSGKNIFRICGERWKNMTNEEKQPYITAANTVRKLKQQKPIEKPEQITKKSVTRISKRKAETKRKETFRKRSKALVPDLLSNSDTDTAATVHSSQSEADDF